MAVVAVQRSGVRVSLASERIEVEWRDQEGAVQRSHIPLADIERVVLPEESSISTPALCRLLRQGVPVCFLDRRGKLLGSFEPPGRAHASARLLQYAVSSSPSRRLPLARALVTAKIANARRVLQRLEANHPRLPSGALNELGALLAAASAAPSVAALRGYEGTAAQHFYVLWSRFLPPEFPFERRSRRPPHNPVNACLSYLAAILHGEFLSSCYAAGLDPALGCLHAPEDGRWSLALDLMEPFRPALVESLALRLLALRVLRAAHFEPRHGGIYLAAAGRRLLWQHYEQRLMREFFSEHVGHRTTLRHLIQNAATHFKTCLERPELFRPFRLN